MESMESVVHHQSDSFNFLLPPIQVPHTHTARMELQNTSPLARSVLAIPELLDHTMNYLSESPEDFHSCALVSKSWVPHAQSYLFREITLVPPNDMNIFGRLMKSLETSPHLAHLIRHLSISLNIQLLEYVTGMVLPRLEELSVHCTDAQYSHRRDISTKHLVQSLLRLPTIRRVTLDGIFNSISVIHAYFDNCSRCLQSLVLSELYVESSPDGSPPDPSTLATVPAKIQLSHLTLPLDFSVLDVWITGLRCPFGLSSLQSIYIPVDKWRSFRGALTPSFHSIEYLKLGDFYDNADLDLSGLTALQSLDVELDQRYDFPGILTALERLPAGSNGLHTLILHIHSVSAKDEKAFREFDAAITTLATMRSLRRVEIHIASRQLDLRPKLDIDTLPSCFPSLSSNGRLFVYPPPPPEIIYVSDAEEEG
ncbi:hypothetical protein MVEN_02118900 [Mycena venus]|uniref:F-box domain-containing protein n=1 Tax=Mycena venus TaxID=2733690 RepID=A0A8H6XAB0_9AGAR|nr:hypothetical protein MVEN_02118900 [Mycena venus]